MKDTTVYIDGFNFYYGAVKGSKYKWLDLKSLSQNILTKDHRVIKIKYFTARISDRGNSKSSTRQMHYINALKQYIPEISIVYGFFKLSKVSGKEVGAPHNNERTTIMKNEEKGSDVNLAVHLVNDAWLGEYQLALVISDDSDLAGALKIVKVHHGKELIVANPYKRRPSFKLAKEANSIRRIREGVYVFLNYQIKFRELLSISRQYGTNFLVSESKHSQQVANRLY